MRMLMMIVAVLAAASACRAQDVKYEKYRLANGLTVILHEDHRLPVVAVNLWFKVGAQNEPKGRSGFAHLFEHLMFMGTERVPGSDFDNLMEAGGGANNASTSLDRTNYFSAGPSSLLPTLLWLEADRLEDLGRTMTQEKLDKQRDIVRNEIRQNVENTPYGRLEDYITRYMYPESHPYHWNVYGLHEDLEASTVDNVKGFFATFYVPNNCSLVVAGDFDSAKVKPLIEGLFGGLASGGEPPRKTREAVGEAKIERSFTVTMLDRVDLPRIRLAYHTPAHFAPGDAEYDLIGAILSEGKSSRLYKRLVLDEQVAVDVAAVQQSADLGSIFTIDITTVPGADLTRVQAMADEEIARLASAGPTAEELEQRKATIEMAMLARVESIEALADRLNEYEYAFGEPNSFRRDLERYLGATVDSVRRCASALKPEERVVVRVLPEEPERQASARDQRPADFAAGSFAPPKPEVMQFSNGLRVLFWHRPEVPLVSASLVVRGAGAATPQGKAGLAHLTAKMLGEGAGELDAVGFSDAMQALGAHFSSGADRTAFRVDVTVLKRNFPRALALMGDAVRRPRMMEADFERVRRLHLEELQQAMNEPTIVAGWAIGPALFGEGHPYAAPVEGTLASVPGITLADVKAMHASMFDAGSATILVSGDLTGPEARGELERVFGDWSSSGARAALREVPAPPARDGLRVLVIDRPGAVQTVIRFAAPAPAASEPGRARLGVLNTILGGSFTSRLNQNLREKNGFTYGAGSSYQLMPGAGMFVARSSVKSEVTGAALREFLGEFSRLRGGPIGAVFVQAPSGDITEAEITKAVETVKAETVQSFQGHAGPLAATAERIAQGLDFASIGADLEALGGITAASLNAEARDATPLERGVLVLVGDKALILEQMKELGLPAAVELDAGGTGGR